MVFWLPAPHTRKSPKTSWKKTPRLRWPNLFSRCASSTGSSCRAALPEITNIRAGIPAQLFLDSHQNLSAEALRRDRPNHTRHKRCLQKSERVCVYSHTRMKCVCGSYLKVFWEAVLVIGIELWDMFDKLLDWNGLHIIWNRANREHFMAVVLSGHEQNRETGNEVTEGTLSRSIQPWP